MELIPQNQRRCFFEILKILSVKPCGFRELHRALANIQGVRAGSHGTLSKYLKLLKLYGYISTTTVMYISGVEVPSDIQVTADLVPSDRKLVKREKYRTTTKGKELEERLSHCAY